jgi:hypothetical protein
VATRFDFQMPDGEKFRLGFLRTADAVEKLQPMLWSVQGVLEGWEAQVFTSQGRVTSGGAWKPRSPASAVIRQAQGLSADGPINEGTGRLRAAMTERGAFGALREVGTQGLVYGVRGLGYAPFVQYGATQRVTAAQRMYLGRTFGVWMRPGHVIKLPRRPVLDLGSGRGGVAPALRRDLIGAARDHVRGALRKGFGGTPPGGWDAEIQRNFDASLERRGGE